MSELTPWHKGDIASFDLETTGIDVFEARIVTASWLEINGTTGETKTFEWMADPGVEIPEAASAVHGVTTERARAEGHPPEQVLREINERMASAKERGVPIIGYNLAYDMSVMEAEGARHNVPITQDNLIVDALVIDKRVDKYRKGGRKLTQAAEHYNVPLDDAHNSSADSLASARIAHKIASRYPEQVQIPLAELHENQKRWYAEQQADFQKYLRGKQTSDPTNTDAPANIPPQWPVRRPGDDEDASHSPYVQGQQATAPAARREQPSWTMPQGKYAFQNEDGTVSVYKVDKPEKGKWAGRVFLKEQLEGELADVRGADAHAILRRIQADPKGAMATYGHSTGNCGKCSRPLTDPESVAAGIGPVCANGI